MSIAEFLKFLVSALVDAPEKVTIEERSGQEEMTWYYIHVDQADMGKIIGKGGKIIQAIRNVTRILAVKENKQIRIDLVETAHS